MSIRLVVATRPPCLAARNAYFGKGTIAVCRDCKHVRYGNAPNDDRCCDWYWCDCDKGSADDDDDDDSACVAAECIACALASKCGDPYHYDRKGCSSCGDK